MTLSEVIRQKRPDMLHVAAHADACGLAYSEHS